MGASSPNTGDTSHSTACAPRFSTCLVASHCLHSIGLPLVLPHVRVNELDNVGSNGSSEYSRKSGLGTALAITVEHRHQRTWRRLQTRDRSQITHFLKISDKTSYAVHLTILSHWRTLVLRGLTWIQHHYRPPLIYSPREGRERNDVLRMLRVEKRWVSWPTLLKVLAVQFQRSIPYHKGFSQKWYVVSDDKRRGQL